MTLFNRSTPLVSGLLVSLVGMILFCGGIWLVVLGGSAYYAMTGAGLLLVGIGLIKGRRWALWLYGAIWLATALWAIGESGLDVWALEPRLLIPTLLGLYLLMPRIRRRLEPRTSVSSIGTIVLPLTGVAMLAGLFFAHAYPGQPEEEAVVQVSSESESMGGQDWHYYGHTPRGERWSPLTQIDRHNVGQLAPAWEYRTGDGVRPGENEHGYEYNFEVTPIKVGETLYICTPHSQVIALDAVSGEERWRFDPKPDTGNNAYLACRGVAYYQAPMAGECAQRIIAPVADARLVALDAHTGEPCKGFGEEGFVSLREHLGNVPRGFHFITSPPLVVNNRVILGGWIYDGQKTNEPSGAVRAFDPLTGRIIWAWDVGHPDGPVAHPAAGDTLTAGTPNAWASIRPIRNAGWSICQRATPYRTTTARIAGHSTSNIQAR